MSDAPGPAHGFDLEYAAEQIRRSRQPFRRFVKGMYLRNILRDVYGPTIDFGCGAGQLLERLPAGSVGVEINPHLIGELRAAGFAVHQANADLKDFELPWIESGYFRTLVIAHVLEHLPEPTVAMRVLLSACRRLGIERVIAIVPGARGFDSDPTHRTYIDRDYVRTRLAINLDGFTLSRVSYFPGSWAWIGKYFIFHELKMVFDRAPDPL